jgi:RecB family endonuclease NucS
LSVIKVDPKAKVWNFSELTITDAKQIIHKAIQQKRLILIIGQCHVEYLGRARSVLTEGERLVILKRDGALLVHKSQAVEPVNWQPPGATIKVQLVDDKLRLFASRAKPRETVRIDFSSILTFCASQLEDPGDFAMYLTEKEMQQVLSENPDLIESGLRTLRHEHAVTPGFIDIYAKDTEGRIVIIEIKRRRADKEAVIQLHNYIKSLQTTQDQSLTIRGILVAPSLTKGTHALLEQLGLEYRKIDPQQCYQYLKEPTSHRLTEYLSDKPQPK